MQCDLAELCLLRAGKVGPFRGSSVGATRSSFSGLDLANSPSFPAVQTRQTLSLSLKLT